MLKKINTQVYKLNLFIKYKRIHFIFYMSLLKFWYLYNNDLKSQAILINNKKKWKINKMLNKKIRNDEIKYFINWKKISFYEAL